MVWQISNKIVYISVIIAEIDSKAQNIIPQYLTVIHMINIILVSVDHIIYSLDEDNGRSYRSSCRYFTRTSWRSVRNLHSRLTTGPSPMRPVFSAKKMIRTYNWVVWDCLEEWCLNMPFPPLSNGFGRLGYRMRTSRYLCSWQCTRGLF